MLQNEVQHACAEGVPGAGGLNGAAQAEGGHEDGLGIAVEAVAAVGSGGDVQHADVGGLLLALLARSQGTTGTIGGTSSGSTGTNTGVSRTPPGNLTPVDDISSTTAAGQQFITLVSKNGSTFYMVIDRNDKDEENVHFMNLVDKADLFALLDEDAQSSYLQSQTPAPTEPVPTETEPAITLYIPLSGSGNLSVQDENFYRGLLFSGGLQLYFTTE